MYVEDYVYSKISLFCNLALALLMGQQTNWQTDK